VSGSSLRVCILAATDALENAREELCRLDAVAGDGDHGVTMALAGRAVRQKLDENPDLEGADLLARIALGMGSVGGAIGPIYATALIRASTALRGAGPVGDAPSVSQLAAIGRAALDGITAIGRAAPGDKTVVDAIAPAVRALEDAEAAGTTLSKALDVAVAAARAGALSTADMIARVGRASRLGERGRGSPDPGASSFVVIIDAALEAYRGRVDHRATGT
jgi:phosphoenolpyruvate---glycerone phosphotransferase subunit DhaL